MQVSIAGPEVKAARQRAGASQAELAAAVGINRAYYSLFEAGRYLLDADEQGRLEKYLFSRGQTVATQNNKSAESTQIGRANKHLAEVIKPKVTPDEEVPNTERTRWSGWNLWSWWKY